MAGEAVVQGFSGGGTRVFRRWRWQERQWYKDFQAVEMVEEAVVQGFSGGGDGRRGGGTRILRRWRWRGGGTYHNYTDRDGTMVERK